MKQTFGRRVRAAFMSGGASLILATAALAAPVLAADQPATTTAASPGLGLHTHQLHGTVKTAPAAGASTFTLTTERYGDVTVSFTPHTPRGHRAAHGSARSHELTSLTDLKVGERLVALGRTTTSGTTFTFVARRVHVLPAAGDGNHATVHLTGTITSTTGTSPLTVKLADGTSQSVTISADTKIRPEGKTLADLKTGTRVTVVGKNGAATGVVILPA